MGVEVIKIEDTLHFDWWRGSLSMGPPEMQVIERSAAFNTANRGKIGATLDLTQSARDRNRQAAGRDRRHRDRKLQPRCDAEAGARMGDARAAQSAPRDDLDAVVRRGRSREQCARLRQHHRGRLGRDRTDGISRWRTTLHFEQCARRSGRRDSTGCSRCWSGCASARTPAAGSISSWRRSRQSIPFVGEAIVEYEVTGKVPKPRGNRHPSMRRTESIARVPATSRSPPNRMSNGVSLRMRSGLDALATILVSRRSRIANATKTRSTRNSRAR